MSKDIFEMDMFSPMNEEETENFENEMLPQNTAKNAKDIDIMPMVELVSQNFERIFE